jgi:hypothetical protein
MDRNDYFATLRFLKNPIKDVLLAALDHVRHFIIREKLILVGGMAIDANLRLKNLKLYGDDEVPDYDFWSPRNAEHAYLLGHELCKLGYENVDVITAIHTTTMKVRVDGNVVADITYMPESIFKTIIVNEYKGVNVVHPWYTMIDQFRSLSLPYENPPNEVILDRWRKDVERLNMLLSVYTLGALSDSKATKKVHKIDIPKDGVLNGWAALAYYVTKNNITGTGLEYSARQVTIPTAHIVVMTTEIDPYLARSGAEPHCPLVSYPRHVRLPAVHAYDFYGERFTVNADNPRVVSLPGLTFFFLNMWLFAQDATSLAAIHIIREIGIDKLSIVPCAATPVSWNTSTLYSIANILDWERVKNWKPQSQPFAECDIKKMFDVLKSPLFRIDGEKSDFVEIAPRSVLL